MDFSFVTHVSIPNPNGTNRKRANAFGAPLLAFSADGTKFAAGTADGVVSVWDVRSKIPLKVYKVDVSSVMNNGNDMIQSPIRYLQFSSGILGREVLVFMEVSWCFSSNFPIDLWNKWPLGQSCNWSEDHPPNRCNIVWNGRNSLLTCTWWFL